MEITNQNFIELLPEISETIQDCDFIAIDTELSGLMRERPLNKADTPDKRFAQNVESSRGYFIMQFGMACFKKVDQHHYNCRAYNFYIFPQPNTSYGDINRTFSIQAHAIQFLSKNGFDFNKLFRYGLSYVTFSEKKQITAQLKDDVKARSAVKLTARGLPDFVPPNLARCSKMWLEKVEKFVEERKAKQSAGGDTSNGPNSDDITMTTTEELEHNRLHIPDCCSNHKRTTFKRLLECQSFYDNVEIIPVDNCDHLVLGYIEKEAKESKQQRNMIAAKGFLAVLERIILNKKILIGHNVLLDMIQVINQFMEPLSDDYQAFRSVCKSLFPLIYDTKYMANAILDSEALGATQSRLGDLYNKFRSSTSEPQLKVDLLDQFLDENKIPHQAGYDAYMTGYCFIELCHRYLGEEKKKIKCMKEEEDSKPVSLAQEKQIQDKFGNKIHLSFSYDHKCYQL